MINATFCFFTHLLFVFLISIFDIKRFNDAYLSCTYVPRTVKFTTFIDESVGKNKLISSKPAGHKILRLFKKDFFCNYPF